MTEPRRRFFPSQPTQQIPGQVVEFGVQLRKQETLQGACACQDVYATWLTTPNVLGYNVIEEEVAPAQTLVRLRTEYWPPGDEEPIYIDVASFVYLGDYSAVPIVDEGTEWEKRVPNLMEAGIVRDIVTDANVQSLGVAGEADDTQYVAIIAGRVLSEPTWQVTWSTADDADPRRSAAGDVVTIRGPLLALRFASWSAWPTMVVLTAEAKCAGAVIATLTLEIRRWPSSGEA